uniref:Uncharacterized protein n=1 Tax=Nymphaea colorata TaxID=210225 RepID=A0A5K1ABY5_9MAGN
MPTQLPVPPPSLSYKTEAAYPKKKEPRGMFATTMLWLRPKFLVPKSSGVADTAMEEMAPVHTPSTAVLT